MLSSQVKFSADRWTDRQTPVKQYAPDLSMRGHKNMSFGIGRKTLQSMFFIVFCLRLVEAWHRLD